MIIHFDAFNRAEQPMLFLCNPGCTYTNGSLSNTLGILGDVHDMEMVANFNEVSELNFRVYKSSYDDATQDAHFNALFKGIMNRRLIYMEDVGFFVINDVTTGFADGIDYKDVSASSVESELEAKQVPYVADGTYQFYTTLGSQSGLLNMLMASMPMWTIGTVASSIASKSRTFEDVDTDSNLLSFLITDVQDAYECIFIFNITTRTINVYDQNDYVVQTPIHITRDDLIRELELSENADDIYTALTVYGADDLTINAVNPIGTGTVYNFDYYIDWMTDGLGEKIEDWKEIISDNESSYATSQTGYYNAMQDVSEYQAEADRLRTSIDLYQRCYDNIIAEGNTSSVISYNKYIEDGGVKISPLIPTSLSKTHAEWESFVAAHGLITAAFDYTEFISVGDKVQFKGSDTSTGSSFYVLAEVTVVTESSVTGSSISGDPVILEVEDELTEDEWEAYANDNSPMEWEPVSIPASLGDGDIAQIKGPLVDGEGVLTGEYYYIPVTVTEHDTTTVTTSARGSSTTLYDIASLQSRIIDETGAAQDDLTTALANLSASLSEAQSYKNTSSIIVATSSLSPRTDAYIRSGSVEYGSEWLSLANGGAALTPSEGKRYYILSSGEHNHKSYTWTGESYVYINPAQHPFVDFTQSDYAELFNYIFEGTYTDEYIAVTDSMTYPEKYAQMSVLYSRAKSQLAKISAPTQEYSVSTENFVFNKDFSHFTSELETGSLINIELEDGDVAALFLCSININWEDKSLSLTFGNRFNRYDVRSLFDDVLGSVKKSANTISYLKDVLYPVKEDTDELKLLYENARNLTKADAMSATDNVVLIDDTGISVKKRVGDSYDGKQLKITNNQIVFTSDAWTNCDTAIGDIVLGDGTTAYGVSAKVLAGDVVEGSRIYGTNITGSNITGTTITGSTMSATNINGGTITGTDIVGGSINVPNGTNPNFAVDSSGNVAMSGSINMSSGSITWGAGSSPTKVLYAVSNIPKPTLPYDSYPSSSSSGWHKVMSASDRYVSYSYDGGTTWTDAIKTIATDGTPGANGYNTAIVYLYKRSATAPSVDWVETLTYSFDLKRITTSIPSGWYASIPADDGNPCYITAASAYSNTSTDTIDASEWSTPVLFVRDGVNGIDGEDGEDGLNSATVFLYKRAASAPSTPSSTLTYVFATGELYGYYTLGYLDPHTIGYVDPLVPTGETLDGWHRAIPSGTDPCYVTQASAVSKSATDTIDSSEWSAASKLVEDGYTPVKGVDYFDGTDGTDGVSIIFKGSFPSAPSSPENGWAYYNTTAKASYVYQGGAWYQMSIDGVNGQNGTDGLSIVWKGESSNPPSNPQTNWAYRDSDDGKVYIYNGSGWELMVLDGSDGEDGTDGTNGLSVFITYNDSPADTTPSTPTGTGTTGGWHTNATAASIWISQKVAESSSSGTWGSPIRIKGTDGTNGMNGYNTAMVYLYKRSASTASVDWTQTLTYSFSNKALTSTPSGWYSSIQSGTDPIYVTAATAYSNTDTDTIAYTEWSTPTVLAQNGVNGANGTNGTDGLNSATVFLYQRSASSPSRPSSALTYTFATGILSGSLGSWSQTIPSGTDPCYVTQASAVSASTTDTIAASEWSTVTMMVENGTDGTDGRGVSSSSVTYQAGASGTTAPTGEWSSTVPTLTPGQYLWTRIIMTYTDSTTSTSYSVSQKAVGISSVVPQYYLSTSSSTQTGGSWSTTVPTWESGKYIWTRSYITWEDSSTTTTTPVLDNAINGMGASYAEIKYDVDHIDIDVLAKQKSATYGFTSDGMTVTVNSVEQIKLGTDGKLTAKNAEIEGEVVADSGSIGNFSIENGALHAAPTSGTGAELKLSNAGVDIQWGPEVFGHFSAIDNEHGELYVAGDGSSYGSHCNIQGANILSVGGSVAIESNNAEVSFTNSVLANATSDGRGVLTLKNSSGNDAIKLYGNVNNNGRIDVLYNGSNRASLWVDSSGVGKLTLYSSGGSAATLDYDKLVQLLALI